MKLLHVVGARPNYMKAASVMRAVAEHGGFQQVLVHTGQHYDAAMNDVFFADLGLPAPDHFLGIGGGSHAAQTARVMMAFEQVLLDEKPDRVVVPGDVNSTVAAAMVASKMGIPIDHVEAGLRSFDRTMPEEINRLVTDALSDLLFIHSPEARDHLLREGRPAESIIAVGNVMVDALERHLPAARQRSTIADAGLLRGKYAVLTLHRPANVDDPAMLKTLLEILGDVARHLPIIFPVHPRTADKLKVAQVPDGLMLTPPKGYLDFLALLDGARLVLTDSGGIQEETTALGVPCLTLRENTERPITCVLGTNQLVGRDRARVRAAVERILDGDVPEGTRPPGWDGQAGRRIAETWAALQPSLPLSASM
jgi:UDP-N-acetylglucosamine 2-epimerase (non-hydrolysing)